MAHQPDSIEAGTSGPGYARAPDHRVAFVPNVQRVVVQSGDRVLAESTDSVMVEETGYPARRYLSRADINMEMLEKDDHFTTYCPFKGLASYYHARVGDDRIERIAWSYEQPYREAEAIRDRLCFDDTKVEHRSGRA